MIDIHSHIIPYIDDGAKDMEVALDMLKIAEKDGTKTIIATPHYYRGYFEKKFSEVERLVEDLKRKAKDSNITIDILPGQEIFLDNNTIKDYRDGKIGTINNSKYMLIELPMMDEFKEAIEIIYELRLLGIVPIVAHPERYSYYRNTPTKINPLIDEGCLFQINSGSIMGLFGKEVQKSAETLIRHGLCSFIASDAHTNNKRSPILRDSLELCSKYDNAIEEKLRSNQQKIIENKDIEYIYEKIKGKKGIFSIFKK